MSMSERENCETYTGYQFKVGMVVHGDSEDHALFTQGLVGFDYVSKLFTMLPLRPVVLCRIPTLYLL